MKTLKKILVGIFAIVLLCAIGIYLFLQSIHPITAEGQNAMTKFTATRISNSPIIHTSLHPRLKEESAKEGYININGPSLIKVPEWVENPLGKYYLYFAHHKGSYIRMAYADSLDGQWTMYDGKILPLKDSGLQTEHGPKTDFSTLRKYCSWSESIALIEVGKAAEESFEKRSGNNSKSSASTTPHLASPEVIINNKTKQLHLYYHGVVEGSLQKSKVAISKDGIHFEAQPEIIALPYLRVFKYRDEYYGLAMPGFLYKSKNGLTDWEVRKRWLFETNTRHFGLHLNENELYIFYSKVGDAPEQILYTKMDMSSENWNDWKVEPSQELLKPELEWEGGNLAIEPSMRGEIADPVNQLRDPDIFKDEDGSLYLLYTGGGEQAIGLAKLVQK